MLFYVYSYFNINICRCERTCVHACMSVCLCVCVCVCVRVCARAYVCGSCFFPFFELSFATAITVLTPASCSCMTSFNHHGKKAVDVGLTCRCNLNNVMPDSIFNDSMFRRMT